MHDRKKSKKRLRVYQDTPLSSGETVALDPGGFNHLIRVLRCKAGDSITVFNGQGGEYQAELVDISRKTAYLAIGEHSTDDLSSPLEIHLGQVMSKADRMDWVIQKSTELGVTEITPLYSEHCDIHLKGERLEKKLAHWQQVAISACEQCGLNRVPTIHPARELKSWCEDVTAELKWVLHPSDSNLQDHHHGSETLSSCAVLIGPEGGLTQEEVSLASSQGYAAITLGPRILRTETAPVVALTLLQWLKGDYRTAPLP